MEMGRIMTLLARAKFLLILLPIVAMVTLSWGGSAFADNYPTTTIRMICSSGAGGTSDFVSRAIAEPLSALLHQNIVVIDMPGANGTLASEHVARSAPDGYTLFSAVDANLVVNPFLYHITYDPFRDFAPISVIVRVRLVLMVPPSGPNTLQELIAKAKANPGKLNYASVGFGSAHHLGMEDFKLRTQTNMVHVPFKGATAAIAALLGGQIDVEFASIGQATPLLQAGKVKVLAVAAPHRTPMLPQVPTMAEAGLPGFELSSWYALLAPAKTSPAIIDLLAKDTKKALDDPRFVKQMQSQGLEIIGTTPSEMVDIMHADTAKWKHLIDVTGARVR
jgi:tripartite-type tricarboxylate transporter receptor subunit TctC